MTASPSTKTEEYSVCEQGDIEKSMRREMAQGQLDMTADMVHRLGQKVRAGEISVEEVVEELKDARAMLRVIEDVVDGADE